MGSPASGGRRTDPPCKAAGDYWVVQEKVGRKTFSRGIWALATTIEKVRAELNAERATEGYTRRLQAGARRRETAQSEYVEDFHGAVVAFLAFHPSTPTSAIGWPVPSPSTPRRSAAAPSPGPNVSRWSSVPRPP
jgi:hypothetical protein